MLKCHPMAKTTYRTTPVPTSGMPPGIPYIIGNEAAERFSFYGMRAILVGFMTKYMLQANGTADHMTDAEANSWFHLFVSSAYFFPLLGAVIADWWWGKYRTIMTLSIVYCLGHLALALNTTRAGLAVGLALIAIGSGGIKPCVSSNVGDQFGPKNQGLLPRVYSWFYFSVNLGSFASMLLIPVLLQKYGPHVAFGTPGLLMLLATWVFWLGRGKFTHAPPGNRLDLRETLNWAGLKSISGLLVIYAFIAVFWSLYDQCSSAWVEQGEKMDLHLFGFAVQSAQLQAANPLFILIYIPLFTYVVYPLLNRVVRLTPLRKIGLGFVFTAVSFLVPAWIETQLAAGAKPNIAWQLLAYTFLIAGEIMVSITGLEFSYVQAPKKMKSMIMAFFLAAVSAGNLFTAAVNYFIQNPDHTSRITGVNYYLFFSGLMFATALLFVVPASRFQERTLAGDET